MELKWKKSTRRVVGVEEKEAVRATYCGGINKCGAGIGMGPAPTESQRAGTGDTPGWGSQQDGGVGRKAGNTGMWEQQCGT